MISIAPVFRSQSQTFQLNLALYAFLAMQNKLLEPACDWQLMKSFSEA
jgi:hypothetical protein